MVSAPGYGQRAIYDLGTASADAGRMELDVFDLKPANLKLAGQVLDMDDKPVAGVNVNFPETASPMATRAPTAMEIPLRACLRRRGANFGQRPEFVRQHFSGRRRHERRAAARSNFRQLARRHDTQAQRHGDGRRRQTRRRRASGGVSVNTDPRWIKTDSNGAFNLNWSLESWQLQNGGALLVARDTARNLAASRGVGGGNHEPRREIETGPTLTGW